MDGDKLAPEGTDTEGAEADSEGSQPAPEGDKAAQQQQPEPSPFAELPYEGARKHYAGNFEGELGQREELGFSRGQGEARKEVAAIRKQVEGEVADRIAFERLEKMRTSEDPEAQDNFRREMADPTTAAIYQRGQEARSRPAPEVTERLRFEAADGFLTELNTHLDDRKELQGLSDEEKAGLAKEKHPTLGALVDAKINLAIQRGVAAGVIKENAQKIQDAKDEREKELLDELGLEHAPEGIEGRKPAKPGSAAELRDQYADGDIETDEYKRKMEAIGAKP